MSETYKCPDCSEKFSSHSLVEQHHRAAHEHHYEYEDQPHFVMPLFEPYFDSSPSSAPDTSSSFDFGGGGGFSGGGADGSF